MAGFIINQENQKKIEHVQIMLNSNMLTTSTI